MILYPSLWYFHLIINMFLRSHLFSRWHTSESSIQKKNLKKWFCIQYHSFESSRQNLWLSSGHSSWNVHVSINIYNFSLYIFDLQSFPLTDNDDDYPLSWDAGVSQICRKYTSQSHMTTKYYEKNEETKMKRTRGQDNIQVSVYQCPSGKMKGLRKKVKKRAKGRRNDKKFQQLEIKNSRESLDVVGRNTCKKKLLSREVQKEERSTKVKRQSNFCLMKGRTSSSRKGNSASSSSQK